MTNNPYTIVMMGAIKQYIAKIYSILEKYQRINYEL